MTSMAAATGKQLADTTNVGEVFKGQGMSFSYSKMENQNGTPFENEKNASLNSPCRSLDPVRKKMFKITSVKKGASGDVLTDNDADSVDGLDESQTEDFSSEFYDNSKVSDLDMDIQDCLNLPLSPDDVMGASITTTILVKQSQKPPDQNCQSRFKVVKIETKEPFRRGKWICYDFYDTTSVTLERTDSKVMEVESNVVPQVSLSGNINSLSSTLDNVGSTSSNTVILPISPVGGEGHAAHFGFVPIQPAPANQVLNQLDGLSSDGMAPFIAQQVLMTEVGVPPSSNSFHNLAQTGHPTIMAHSNIFPYDQNGPTVGMFQNGLSDGIHIPSDTISITSSGASTMLPTVAPATNLTSVAHHNQTLTTSNGIQVIHTSPSQTQIGGDTVEAYDVSSMTESGPGMTHFSHSKTDTVIATGLGITDPLYPTTAESSERITALQGVAGANPSSVGFCLMI